MFVPTLTFTLLAGFVGGAVAVGVTVVVSLVILAVFVDALRRRRSGRTPGKGDRAEGSIRDAIPSDQYNGPYAETGASTRGAQEKSLRETQKNATETERHLRKRSR